MAVIRERKIGNQMFYYIEHSIRQGKKVLKKEKYLGKKLPDDTNKLKEAFVKEINNEKFYPVLDQIKKNFVKELKQTPKVAKEKNLESFGVKFTYDSQRIEGSTLSLRETANLLEKGISPNEKPVQDIKEAEAHQKLFLEILDYEKDLSLAVVLDWHKELLCNSKIAGLIRKHQVLISGSKFKPPFSAELEVLLREFFSWYVKSKIHPVELAALVHLKFVTIHPFADGNGRISRLMMNFVLSKHDFPLLDIHYEDRNSYYNALERSQVKNDETIFLKWFFKRYIKEYKKYV
ncbi:MAG: Fic family protein [Nanoarchaeota archaeon]|nr:Fic family protein [Nanoarchaeota archaeon]MBU4241703.1 Fic family protein [Nanoarchaeota archaeon]MBU4352676.1 Fic family protein [Nanoarchaeota archaeon]MBU4456161.1 Fic family protein [Nanoarchaeota archaeon]MCG2719227.1 Fic family protein [Nanoarchaeota archaeon]